MKTLRQHYLSIVLGAIFSIAIAASPVLAQGGSGVSPDASGGGMGSGPGGGMPPEGMQGAPGGMPGGTGGAPDAGMPNGTGGGFPMGGGPGGMPGGHASIDAAKKTVENAVIVIDADSVEINEDAATLERGDGSIVTADRVSGVSIFSGNTQNKYNEGEDAVDFGVSGIAILDADVKIGGSEECFTVKKNADGVPVATKKKSGGEYNSVIILDNSDDAFERRSTELANGVAVSIGGDDSVGKLLEIENVYMWVDGWKRTTVFSNYASGAQNAGPKLSGPFVVVKDSYLEGAGGENYKYGWMALYGGARATLIQASSAWFYNDIVKTEGWGSLAIDGGPVINVYAVNSDVENYGGGYTIYSPGDGWAELFGVKAVSAQYGMFLTGTASGRIEALSDAVGTDAEKYMKISDIDRDEYVNSGGRSYIEADFAAFLVHLGGANSAATLHAKNSTLSTRNSLTLHDDSNLLNDGNSGAAWFWVDDWRGSTLLSRSANPTMNLDNVELISRTGTIFKSVVDWEGPDKKQQFSIADDTEAAGIALNMSNMTVKGDILHEDFFRKMDLRLSNTTLAGRVFSGTKASWNAKWTEERLRSSDAWKTAETEVAGWAEKAPNSIFTYDPEFSPDVKAISEFLYYDDAYDDIWGVRMTIDENSTWKVSGNSSLYSLTIEDGARIEAPAGFEMVIYKDCPMDTGEPLYDYSSGKVIKNIEPGITYNGIVILVHKKS